ncbi:MAG: hypothetical protein PHT84_03265 [Candidatus Pacebacteria bacterium]|nr:hypothetical protein [Candidatus Paceibacterota bacterium]
MKKKKQKGYSILFTVVLVSIISLIGIGLSNTTYKQLLISSGAKDSQSAFFQSDMATECALYADVGTDGAILSGFSFNCGIDEDGNPYNLQITKNSDDYNLKANGVPISDPCFEINIQKTLTATSEDTDIFASGYNVCNKSGSRTVERTIEVNY